MSVAPFLRGQMAYRHGEPVSANPFDDRAFHPDDYPGKHEAWRWGWLNAKHTEEHKKRMKV